MIRRLALTLAVCGGLAVAPLAPAVAAPAPVVRSQAASLLPFARSNAAVVEAHGRLYIFGGGNDKGASTSAWEYDPTANSWRDLPPLPTACFAQGAALVGNRILLFGGMSDDHTYLSSIDAFDLATRTWSSAGQMPLKVARFALVSLDGRLWCLGGATEKGCTDAIMSYEPATGKWDTQAGHLPEPLARLAAVPLNGAVYIFGGEGKDGKARKGVYRWDVTVGSWKKGHSLGVPRKNLSAARLGDRILVVGGWDIVDDAHQYITWIESYTPQADPQKDTCSTAGNIETPRDGCRAIPLHGRVYVVGGFNGDYVADIEEVHWTEKSVSWRVDPSLKFTLGLMDQIGSAGANPVRPEPLANEDVVEVSLSSLQPLDLPLPASASGTNLYLKAYQYPDSADHEISARRVLTPLLLTDTALGDTLRAFLQTRDSVVVEKGVVAGVDAFGAKHAFPPLEVPSAPTAVDGVEHTPQQFVDEHVVFSSLYVRGVDAAHNAKESLLGLEACRQDLMVLFGRAYVEINGPESAKFAYFLDDSALDGLGDAPRVAVMRVPRSVLAYDDWEKRPLPQNPHDRLSGMLCLHRDVYTLRQRPAARDAAAIAAAASQHRGEVLEIGAAYRPEPGH